MKIWFNNVDDFIKNAENGGTYSMQRFFVDTNKKK